MIYVSKGNLFIDNEVVTINYLLFKEEISRGANGIVFLAYDTVLKREVAVKIWLSFRARDIRNKKEQGVIEAQKACAARDAIHEWHDERIDNPYFIPDENDILRVTEQLIGQIYFAGYHKEYFYTVMEFIKGITLEDFLKGNIDSLRIIPQGGTIFRDESQRIPFGVKANIALNLIRYNRILLKNGINHGDLHLRNIMITKYYYQHKNASIEYYHTFEMKIIDFGTSYFMGKEVSIERSFDILMDTVNQCIFPFRLEEINACGEYEDKTDIEKMTTWLTRQLYALRAAFFELGQEYVGWPLYRAFGTYLLTTKGFDIQTDKIKELITEQEKTGAIKMSEQFLGVSEEWDTFDGRTAVRGD